MFLSVNSLSLSFTYYYTFTDHFYTDCVFHPFFCRPVLLRSDDFLRGGESCIAARTRAETETKKTQIKKRSEQRRLCKVQSFTVIFLRSTTYF